MYCSFTLYSCHDTCVGLCTVVVKLQTYQGFGLCTVVVQLPRYLCMIMYCCCKAAKIPRFGIMYSCQDTCVGLCSVVVKLQRYQGLGLCTVVVQLPRYLCRIMYYSCTTAKITKFNLLISIYQ